MEIKFEFFDAKEPRSLDFSSGRGRYELYFGSVNYCGNGVVSIEISEAYAKDTFESVLSELIGLNPEMELKGLLGPLELKGYEKFVVVFGKK